MRTVVDLELPVAADRVWPHVSELDRYGTWMRLVHAATPEPPRGAAAPEAVDGGATGALEEAVHPAWQVELRARVGPFARSKRLRMVRTEMDPGRRARFERAELDDREHSAWVLAATLEPRDEGTLLRMDLHYGGRLWTAGVLETVLNQEIQRGKAALLEQVTTAPGDT